MRNLISIFLSSIILLGSMQLRVGMHLCGGELKDMALFGKAEACSHGAADAHEDENIPACHRHLFAKKKKKDGCCNDLEVVIETLDITSVVSGYQKIVEQSWVALPIEWFQMEEVFKPAVLQRKKYLNYKPPLIFRDIPVLTQTFLI